MEDFDFQEFTNFWVVKAIISSENQTWFLSDSTFTSVILWFSLGKLQCVDISISDHDNDVNDELTPSFSHSHWLYQSEFRVLFLWWGGGCTNLILMSATACSGLLYFLFSVVTRCTWQSSVLHSRAMNCQNVSIRARGLCDHGLFVWLFMTGRMTFDQ